MVLLQCLPCINGIFRIFFDSTVAVCSTLATVGNKGGKKKAAKGMATSVKGFVKNQIKQQMAAAMNTAGGAPRVPQGAAQTGTSFGDAISNVRISGTGANGETIHRVGEELPNVKVRQTVRAVLKKRRAARQPQNGGAVASFVDDVRAFANRIFGAKPEESTVGLLISSDEECAKV